VSQRDGSTPANAIVMGGCTPADSYAIVMDEAAWGRRNCPGFTRSRQMLLHVDGKVFDQLTFGSESEVRVVYFDISLPFLKGLRLARRRLVRHRSRHRRRCAYVVKRIRARIWRFVRSIPKDP
jgi:hypothetical protein